MIISRRSLVSHDVVLSLAVNFNAAGLTPNQSAVAGYFNSGLNAASALLLRLKIPGGANRDGREAVTFTL